MTKLQRLDPRKKGDTCVLHDVIINQVNQHLGDRNCVIADSNTGFFHYVVLFRIAN